MAINSSEGLEVPQTGLEVLCFQNASLYFQMHAVVLKWYIAYKEKHIHTV